MSTIKGIIFDMDNTIIKSNIDFKRLKEETYCYLLGEHLADKQLNLNQYTTAMLINKALSEYEISNEQINKLWQVVTKIEVDGMVGATLEEGVVDLLFALQGKYKLVVITNNALEAAQKALKENGIFHYFDDVIAREQMPQMKPSPSSYLMVLNKYTEIKAQHWISVGDSWIDGRASIDAGIRFIAYRANIENLMEHKVEPVAYIRNINELTTFI